MDDFLVERVAASKKAAFARHFQRYLREHAAFTGKQPVDGVYQYPWFDLYWREEGARWPFWMRRAEAMAALALVRLDDADGCYHMAEFFVAPCFRRHGLGARFAADVMRSFEGSWKLDVVKRNDGAVAFWRRTIGDRAAFDEAPLVLDDGVQRIELRFTV
jgi:predicted acetyltransferase